MNHSSTLEFSSRPPVSVYSTGRHEINDSAFSRQYGSQRLSPRPKVRGTFGFTAKGGFASPQIGYALQRAIPSARAPSLLRPRFSLLTGAGMLTGCPSACAHYTGCALGPD